MKKMVNGKLVELSPEEIAAAQKQQEEFERQERSRPLSESEIWAMLMPTLIAQQINTLSVDDTTALRMSSHYPDWADKTEYDKGYRVQYNGNLYRCLQAHTSQPDWVPDKAQSLWTHIDETHGGTKSDPIPYNNNMELESGKYYTQDGVTYRCTRSTGQPVYNPLKELFGLYVEKI